MIEKYGVIHPLQNEDIKNKTKKTNIEKYGFDNPMKNEEVKNRLKNTIKIYRNTYEYYNKIKQSHLKRFIPILKKQLEYLNLKLLDEKYVDAFFKHNWKCLECGHEFKQIWNAIQQRYTCPMCYPRNIGYSKYEKEIIEFIKSIEKSEIIKNSKEIINPYELDIYIPEKNIAIEFDGLYWHSEEKGKDKYYHLNKTKLCESKNIRLIHIFEDEWIYKKDIIKYRIKHILNNNNSNRIHTRMCKIKEISNQDKNIFLYNYHLQGEDRSNIKLGAFYNDKLIAVMTFSYGNISKGLKKKNEIWELNRFCSNSNYHIPGIAGKLLSHFKQNYKWKEIFSYADRRWSVGNLYKKIGFELDSITKPNYWYVNHLNRIHRFNLRKKSNEPKDIPEWILRQKEGYFRIWDCGHYKFKMIKGDFNERN